MDFVFLSGYFKTSTLNDAGTDDEQQDYNYLGAWGPRFDKLHNMYGNEHHTDLDLDLH